MAYTASLHLSGLPLHIHLGVTEHERAFSQKVLVHFTLYFAQLPGGCHSDHYADVLCYQRISEHITCFTKHKTYLLIEKLAVDVLQALRNIVDNALPDHRIGLVVEIEKLTLPFLEGSARFKVTDMTEGLHP